LLLYFIKVGEGLDDNKGPIFRDSVHRSVHWMIRVFSRYARDDTHALLRIERETTLKNVISIGKRFLEGNLDCGVFNTLKFVFNVFNTGHCIFQ